MNHEDELQHEGLIPVSPDNSVENPIFLNNDIDIENLPSLDSAQFHPLERSYRSILIATAVILWCILIIAAWLVLPQLDITVWLIFRLTIGLIVTFVIFGLVHMILISLGFSKKGYAVRQRDISYKTGLLFRRSTTIPYSRIQHIEVRQGVLERYFKLGKLKIFTAGGQSSDLSIPGLRLDEAQHLRSFILRTMDSDEEE